MYFAVLGKMLTKAVAALLDWHRALVVRLSVLYELPCRETRDYTSLFPSGVDMSSSVAWAPEQGSVRGHPYVRSLILLSSIVGFLLGVWNLVWPYHKSKQFAELTWLLSPAISWDFTP